VFYLNSSITKLIMRVRTIDVNNLLRRVGRLAHFKQDIRFSSKVLRYTHHTVQKGIRIGTQDHTPRRTHPLAPYHQTPWRYSESRLHLSDVDAMERLNVMKVHVFHVFRSFQGVPNCSIQAVCPAGAFLCKLGLASRRRTMPRRKKDET